MSETQKIINELSAGYDSGDLSRWAVKQKLLQYLTEGKITEGMIERLFDLIVG